MRYNKDWGKPGKPGEAKRKTPPQKQDPLKRGPFQPTEAFLRFVQENLYNRKTSYSKPKSIYRHGLRVLFAECDPFLLFEISKLAQDTFVKHTAAHSVIDKGYFDLAFKNAADVEEASNIVLKINNRFVPTIRTRYASDTNLFIGFDGLPCTMDRELLINFLKEGLMCYGQIVELELNRDPLFYNSSSSRGYAIIEPLPGISEDISLIPRLAHFEHERFRSSTFRVTPEKAPLSCTLCHNLGHTNNACPDQLAKLFKKPFDTASEPDSDNMEIDEEVDGDELLDNISETGGPTDLNESYVWGDLSYYKVINPTTKEQRREAQSKFHNEHQTNNPTQNKVFPSPNSPTPSLDHKKVFQNISVPPETQPRLEGQFTNPIPCFDTQNEFSRNIPMNPFGDGKPNPKPANRGRGRPRKEKPNLQSELTNVNTVNSDPKIPQPQINTQLSQLQPNSEQILSSPQYQPESISYEPTGEKIVNEHENHSRYMEDSPGY